MRFPWGRLHNMIILAIETTGPRASVALISETGDIMEKTSDVDMNHLKGLIPMIKVMIDECGCGINDIKYVAASVGPGSFTGIRIGVATARALAQTWAVKTISVPTLESFVYHSDQCGYSMDSENCISLVCPIFDARRSQIYGGAYYLDNEGKLNTLLGGDAWDIDQFFDSLVQKLKVPIQSPRVVATAEPQSPATARGLRVKPAMTGLKDRTTEYEQNVKAEAGRDHLD